VGKALRAAKMAAASSVALAAAFTAVMGYAHTKAGRPLLVALRPVMSVMGGKCPFGYDIKATPEQKDAARIAFSRSHHGKETTAARPALGFKLDETTKGEVLAWAKQQGVACTEPKVGYDVECRNVPDRLLPEGVRGASVSSLWLTFGGQGTLTSVVAVRNDPRAEVISHTFTRIKDDLAAEAGAPSKTEGSGAAAELSSGLLVQSTAEYRFKNYYALARAANTGSAFVLTEEYRSLAD
jgi:hypothetical protein